MRYFFLFRPYPKVGYKGYKKDILNCEKITEQDISKCVSRDIPICVEHETFKYEGKDYLIPIGKVIYDFVNEDGTSRYSVAYIDDSNNLGKSTIMNLQDSVISHVSPSLRFRPKTNEDMTKLDWEKDCFEFSLTEKPDYGGEDGCEIFGGSLETDLNNIKMNDYMKSLKESTLPLVTESAGILHEK